MKLGVILSLMFVASQGLGTSYGNHSIGSFSQSKKLLPGIFEKVGQKTLYCGCEFKGKSLDSKNCNYKPKRVKNKSGKINLRTQRIEWEHIVPAHAFGYSFREWRDHKSFGVCRHRKGKSIGARSCASKLSQAFRKMEADLYNLFPAIGEINGLRSNFSMAEIPGEKREFGGCDVEISNHKVEPREAIRGLIARVYLYMDWAYPGHGIIKKKGTGRKLYEAWSQKYPVTPWERSWAKEVMKVQGNCNPFVLKCPSKNLNM